MSRPPDAPDGALLEAFQSGESEAFDLLVERYQGRLLRFARGLLADGSVAEDVVQESFLRLIRSTPVIGSDGVLGPWLFRVCRNLAYDNRKMETREMQRRERATAPEPPPTPVGNSEQAETTALLRQEMLRLPEREREALRLKVHEGMSYAQIGAVLGVAPGTVGWLVHQAMNRLTDRLRAAQAI